MHLNGFVSVSGALFAPSAFGVKREPPCLPAANLALGQLSKQFAYVVEHVGVGGGVGPRSAPDRGLVHVDDLVHRFHPFERTVRERLLLGTVEPAAEDRVERLVNKTGFARTAHTRHAYHPSQRKTYGHIFEVIPSAACQFKPFFRLSGIPFFRNNDRLFAFQVLRSQCVRFEQFSGRAAEEHLSAQTACFRANIDHPVGLSHHFFVVLDHDNRVAHVTQFFERSDKPLVVPLVQSDRGFVENVQHIDQTASYLCGQTDTLALAS